MRQGEVAARARGARARWNAQKNTKKHRASAASAPARERRLQSNAQREGNVEGWQARGRGAESRNKKRGRGPGATLPPSAAYPCATWRFPRSLPRAGTRSWCKPRPGKRKRKQKGGERARESARGEARTSHLELIAIPS